MQNITDSRNTANNTNDQPVSLIGDLFDLSFTEIKEVTGHVCDLSTSESSELETYTRVKKFSLQRLISKAIQAFEVLGGYVSAYQLERVHRDDLTFVVWDVFERDAKAILAAA